MDDVIQSVFKFYSPSEYHAELIVRVPHMIAHYGLIEATKKLKQQAPELLDFYLNHVLPECKKYLNAQNSYNYKSVLLEVDRLSVNENNIDIKVDFLLIKAKIL